MEQIVKIKKSKSPTTNDFREFQKSYPEISVSPLFHNDIGNYVNLRNRNTIMYYAIEEFVELYPNYRINSVKIHMDLNDGLFVDVLLIEKKY